jgi:hypothetical protein
MQAMAVASIRAARRFHVLGVEQKGLDWPRAGEVPAKLRCRAMTWLASRSRNSARPAPTWRSKSDIIVRPAALLPI